MPSEEIMQAILRLKRERDAVILAHNYQSLEVQEIADYVGDSLELARRSRRVRQQVIIFCGVTFMAESAKLLSPDKRVLIPEPKATCALADKISPEQIRALKLRHPEAIVVGYVNTYADVKAECDVCVTSANAADIVRSLPNGEVIFLPDRNLAHYCERLAKRPLIKWQGYCYVHHRLIRRPDVKKLIEKYPHAVVIAHPECTNEVLSLADHICGTTGMLGVVAKETARDFIILTEVGLIERLRKEYPQKNFYCIENAICDTMKMTTVEKVFQCLHDLSNEVSISEEIAQVARASLEKMMELS